MSKRTTKTANDNIDTGNQEVTGPADILQDQSLAVDLVHAEIDSQIQTAHKYPRSIDTVIKKISMMACYNEAAAENCLYALPRAGKPIIGPSIGFANIVAQSWGNCRVGARHTYTDRKEKVVEAQGVFHDLESNSATSLSVQRRISGRDGRIFNDDMIAVTGNAAVSIARRKVILNGVSHVFWFPIFEQVLAIVRGTKETFTERKEKAIKAFAQFGVKPEQLFMFLGLKGDADLTIEHIPTLRGMYQQLRDGTITVEEMFDPRRMTGMGFEQVKNPLADDEGDSEDADAGDDDGSASETVAETTQPRQDPTANRKPAGEAMAAAGGRQGASAPNEHTPKPTKKAATVKPAEQEQEQAGGKDTLAGAGAEDAKSTKWDTTPKPKTDTEYEAHWMAFVAAATSLGELDNRWKGEKQLRTDCGVTGDLYSRCYMAWKDRQNALRGA